MGRGLLLGAVLLAGCAGERVDGPARVDCAQRESLDEALSDLHGELAAVQAELRQHPQRARNLLRQQSWLTSDGEVRSREGAHLLVRTDDGGLLWAELGRATRIQTEGPHAPHRITEGTRVRARGWMEGGRQHVELLVLLPALRKDERSREELE